MSRAAERPLVYPKTEVQDVAETRFGTTVRDPYRWLEAEGRVDPKVRAFDFGRSTAPRMKGHRESMQHE